MTLHPAAPTRPEHEVRTRRAALDVVAARWPATTFTVHGLGNERTHLRWRDGAPDAAVRRLLAAVWDRADGPREPLHLARSITGHTVILGLLRTHRAQRSTETALTIHTHTNPDTSTREERAVVALLAARAGVPEHHPYDATDTPRHESVIACVAEYADAITATLTP